MSKEKVNMEEFKDLIDSRLYSKSEIDENSQNILRERFITYERSNEEDIISMGLYRLKLLLEEEISSDELNAPFYSYASTYVDSLYRSRKLFAKDIDFSETQLSLILSGKRPATAEFVAKIKVHATKVYEQLKIDFDSTIWFKVYHLDRMHSFLKKYADEKVSTERMKVKLKALKLK